MKRGLLIITCIVLTGASQAQNEEDVLRYSFQPLMGTPRSLALGGSMGAVGGDLSSVHTNPAGLAFFRQNTYIVGLGFSNWVTESSYIGVPGNGDSKSNVNIPNLGIAFTHIRRNLGKEVKTGIINYSFALTLNRRNNFHQRIAYTGINNSSSILDYFAEIAAGYDSSALGDFNSLPSLAWNTYLINEDVNTAYPNDYVANLPNTISLLQRNKIENAGRQQDWSGSFALNISHRVYLGATLNINALYFEQTNVWEEESQDSSQRLYMRYTNAFQSSGTGFSANVGAIVRVNDYLRLGLSYYSGARYFITDEYRFSMSSQNFDPGVNHSGESDLGVFNYSIKVPARIEGGIAVLIPNRAVFSADIENVRYQTGSLRSADVSFEGENKAIRDNFASAYNVRVGAELLSGAFRYRAGYAYQGAPLKDNRGYSLGSNTYTIGLGYRQESGFFVDFVAMLRTNTSLYTPYKLVNSTRESYTAIHDTRQLSLAISVGSSF